MFPYYVRGRFLDRPEGESGATFSTGRAEPRRPCWWPVDAAQMSFSPTSRRHYSFPRPRLAPAHSPLPSASVPTASDASLPDIRSGAGRGDTVNTTSELYFAV